MGKLERDFQPQLIEQIKGLFPGCIIMKQDSAYRQGIPDLLILFRDKWALLEVKKSANERPRPNQPYYVNWAHENSYGAFVYPENMREILADLMNHFR